MDKRKILKNTPSKIFWIANSAAWLAAALLNFLFQLFRTSFDVDRSLYSFFPMIWCYILTTLLRFYWGIIDIYKFKPARLIFTVIPQVILATVLVVSFGIGSILLLRTTPGNIPLLMLNNFLSILPINLLWSTFYFLYVYYILTRKKEIDNLRLINSLQIARLESLKAQLNPHFLFNTLNNIRSLIREDKERARDMISSLTDILRYSLTQKAENKTTVKDEIVFLDQYLILEKLHMEERLKYSINTEQDCINALVPPMIMQILAENSIKHGISRLPEGGEIDITISKKGDLLFISVSNTGSLSEDKSGKGNGIGIENIIERLRLLYENKASFRLENSGNRVTAFLEIPYEVKNENSHS